MSPPSSSLSTAPSVVTRGRALLPATPPMRARQQDSSSARTSRASASASNWIGSCMNGNCSFIAGSGSRWQGVADGRDLNRPPVITRLPAARVPELGRASCRERVCQYVYIPVVAVPLKKTSYPHPPTPPPPHPTHTH